ncbi:hypothetical protein IEN85_20215 [Pelagicoccus sp. NFK12]|uniref:Uncharacterized protein n=1 Tax=Pelagicoccus enzymogenes TaxID=2773457 RepID=A0A927FBB3_9BACT|nr:hypothetical protein [Pelagicoccus enzymogenes]MBD5781837.1 hypothetical protein [Pelagicoccus enzymogenes]MDQ8196593.1 hypothetical protein [Pelagicoccus enzymogenes]
MSFDSAIPVNRIAYGRNESFGHESRGRSAYESKEERSGSRQTVNISQDTLLKVARAKLGRMVDARRGYNQHGLLAGEPTVGSLLSTKA